MNKITLGKTNLVIEKNGFGCLPIQRIREQDAVDLLHKAYDGGINFFDTARAYSDSEQKVGAAFSSMRDKIVLATKTGAQTAEGFRKDLETSLRTLKTDYIDIYQFHNPAFCPKPGGEDGLYDAALEAKKQGKIRHISITNHRLAVAHEAIDSGLYETLQFPFSYLAGEQEMELVRKCRETNMGFIAMKGMAGGLIRDGFTAAAWMAQQDGVVPIWGVQRESELDQFLQCIREGVELTDERKATIERLRLVAAIAPDPAAKKLFYMLSVKLSAEGADRWYRCFYHNLRVRMDEYYHDKAVMERVLNDRREGCYGEADEV